MKKQEIEQLKAINNKLESLERKIDHFIDVVTVYFEPKIDGNHVGEDFTIEERY